MKKLLFFVLAICLIVSCEFGVYRINKNLIPEIKDKELICFKDSSSAKVDSFIMSVKEMWYVTQEDYNNQSFSIIYNNLRTNKKAFDVNISWRIVDPIRTNITLCSNPHILFMVYYSPKEKNITLNNILYPELYVLDNVYNETLDTVPLRTYYTLKNGIIRYEYKDGRVYNLVSK